MFTPFQLLNSLAKAAILKHSEPARLEGSTDTISLKGKQMRRQVRIGHIKAALCDCEFLCL